MSAKTKLQLETELMEAQATIAKLERDLQKARAGGQAKKPARKNPPKRSQTEEDLLHLLDVLPVGVSILNGERKVVFQNSALSHILDMTPEGIQTGAYKDRKYLAADGSAMPADGFASVQAHQSGQAVYNVETGVIKENGETIWTSVSAVPADLPDWKMVIVTTDITERKQYEFALQQSEEKYSALFEKSAVPAALTRMPEGVFVDINEAFQSVLGYSRAEVIGKTSLEIGMTLPAERTQTALDLEKHNFLRDNEKHLFTKSGEARIATINVSKVKIGGQDFVITTIHDITERKRVEEKLLQSEEKFSLAFNKSPVALSLTRMADGKFIDANEVYQNVFEFTRDELIGHTSVELNIVTPEARRKLMEQQRAAGGTQNAEIELRAKSGRLVPGLFSSGLITLNGETHLLNTLIDITEWKRAAKEAQEYQRKVQLFVEYSPAAIAMFDKEMRYLVASHRFLLDYRIPTQDIIGRSHYEIFPEISERWKDIHKRCLAGAVESEEAELFIRTDGTFDWVRWEIRPWYEADGSIGGIILFSEVVTDKVQLEQRQATLTERLDLATRSSGIGIWDWDIQKNEIVWDEEMYALYGLKPGEFGGAYEAWLHGVHPEDREPGNEISAAAVRGEREYDTEFRVVWPDGSVHWLKANGKVFYDNAGAPQRMVGINFDITERKQAEQKLRESEEFLRLAYEATDLGIWKNDLITGSVEFDERARIHYGFDTVQTTIPELMSHIHPDDVNRLGSEIAAVTGPTGDGKFATEYRVIHPDGSVHWLAVGVRVTFEGEGEERHAVMGYGTLMDITERKLMEEKLIESEERFRIALNNSPIVVFNQDRDLRYSWIHNPGMGFSPEAILGKTDAELLSAEDAAVLTAIKQRVLKTGTSAREEIKATSNEQAFFYDLTVEPLRDVNGTIIGVTCVSVDITKRKQAEEALRQSQNNFAKAFDINPTALVITRNADGVFLNINNAYTAIMGYERSDIIDHKVIDFPIYPDLEVRDKLLNSYAEQGRVTNFELTVRDKGQNLHDILVSLEPIVYNNEDCILSAFVDITGLKQAQKDLRASQELLQSVIDNTPALVYSLDLEGRFLLINRPLEKLFGHTNAEMIGHSRAEFIEPELAEQHRINDLEIFRSGEPKIFEEENMEPDGRHVYLTTKFPLRDANGNIYAVCGISTDMTERKLIEEELIRSNAELEQFAYIASHDLQEPLRAVAGMVQLLQKRYEGQLDERADEYIKHAVDAAARMQSLIQALLSYSRAQRDNQPMEQVDAGTSLQLALKNLDTSIRDNHAVITADALPRVHANPAQLTQLFQNLIGNAIKFRRDVEPQIHISATKLTDAWQFSVRDNGIGIEPQYFERIFMIFQRLHTQREFSGTGIGLALCKKIIERHGGRIWVESEPEHGSVFHFTLPLRRNL